MTVWRVRYGADPGQFGDLHIPGDGGPYPVVVAIHGGWWRLPPAQSRNPKGYRMEGLDALSYFLMERGFAVWNVNYRVVGEPGGGWPATLLDVALAADFVRANLAEQYPLDRHRVISLGWSAGGHLALWLAGRHRIPEGSPLYTADPFTLRGAVALAGVGNLREGSELGLGDGAVNGVLGGTYATYPDRYASASPLELLPLGAPQLVVHGTADSQVPFACTLRYAEAAMRAGDPVEVVAVEGASHNMVNPDAAPWPEAINYLEKLLS